MGQTVTCAANATFCGVTEVYGLFTLRGRSSELANIRPSLNSIAAIQSVAIPSTGMAFLSLGIRTHRDLKGRETTTFPLTARTVRPFGVDRNPQKAIYGLRGVSFAIELNAFSFDLEESLITEVVTYSALDVFATVAAIFSLTLSSLVCLFPHNPTLPIHFRFGQHGKKRNLELVVSDKPKELAGECGGGDVALAAL